ncbi:MAG: hypothetical protein IKS60_03810 [Lachnospiraceae bacterium]|nr:hypothetical protein [Lachnospiraceae bacterium]MBR5917653.1 hypothetical protein [Lachnospiraceae bacterium]
MLVEEQDVKVYSDLFDHVKKTLEENKQTLDCNKTGFLYSTGTPPKDIDYDELKVLDSEAFLSCIFLKCFQRLPSKEEIDICTQMNRIQLLKYVANKASYSIRGVHITHCVYNPRPGIRGRVFGLAAKIVSSAKLRKIAKKMPKGIQSKIRGTFR